MFNLNRTLPKPEKGTWNSNIRKNIRTQRNASPISHIRAESENTYNRFTGAAKLGSGNGERNNLQTLLGNSPHDVQYAEAMKLIRI